MLISYSVSYFFLNIVENSKITFIQSEKQIKHIDTLLTCYMTNFVGISVDKDMIASAVNSCTNACL